MLFLPYSIVDQYFVINIFQTAYSCFCIHQINFAAFLDSFIWLFWQKIAAVGGVGVVSNPHICLNIIYNYFSEHSHCI